MEFSFCSRSFANVSAMLWATSDRSLAEEWSNDHRETRRCGGGHVSTSLARAPHQTERR